MEVEQEVPTQSITQVPQAEGQDPRGEVPPMSMLDLMREMLGLIQETRQHRVPPPPATPTSSRGLLGEIKRPSPRPFEGAADPHATEQWTREMEKTFEVFQTTEAEMIKTAVYMLQGPAEDCSTVEQYETEFNRLARFLPDMVPTEESRVMKCKAGLRPSLKKIVTSHIYKTYTEVVARAKYTEASCQGAVQGSSQKEKKDKGTNSQGQSSGKSSGKRRPDNKYRPYGKPTRSTASSGGHQLV
ncbi:hypothetical protein J5N97_024768 [Dioscorea zingiberensis]|uniref:Retrotransposon gag domain-containing protein n=1 Tax=Dioscorea zingiberensis TaxID=325984 RepID=A0A9D5C7A9_9LILI|nr:hypothetical protein J5N97_024768 [Dioscorea zingiberensis]